MIALPGLRGDDALGFLAAVGILALSEQGLLRPLCLGWSGGATPIAQIEGGFESLDELGNELLEAAESLRELHAALPGVRGGFPLHKRGSGSDPMRMPRERMIKFFEEASEAWTDHGDPWFGRWLLGLCAQTTTRPEGDVALTPFYAPTGQMALRSSIFDKTYEAMRTVGGPGDALTAWRRTAYDGANFDQRAKRDAAVTTTGKANNQGAPSPTWLASMGMRMFAVVDPEAGPAGAVAWQAVRLYRGYTARSLIWPIWSMSLNAAAVRILLAHPDLRVQRDDQRVHLVHAQRLPALGVTSVFGCSRRTLQQGDGPLGPTVSVWSSPITAARRNRAAAHGKRSGARARRP